MLVLSPAWVLPYPWTREERTAVLGKVTFTPH